MTDYQKKRITLMRKQNVGYATIAKELRLSLGAVKQFCRRNGLQSGTLETDTQPENISESQPDVDLISTENRGIDVNSERESLCSHQKTKLYPQKKECTVFCVFDDDNRVPGFSAIRGRKGLSRQRKTLENAVFSRAVVVATGLEEKIGLFS